MRTIIMTIVMAMVIAVSSTSALANPWIALCDSQGNEKSIDLNSLSGFNPEEDYENMPLESIVATPEHIEICFSEDDQTMVCAIAPYTVFTDADKKNNVVIINGGEVAITIGEIQKAMNSGKPVQSLEDLQKFSRN